MLKIAVRSVLGSFLFFLCFCGGLQSVMAEQEVVGKEILFASFSGKVLPFKPVEPISAEKAASLPSYLKAVYDDKGRLVTLTKYIDDKVYFVQTVNYENGKIIGVVVRDADGAITMQKKMQSYEESE